jgi:hypothetical protein
MPPRKSRLIAEIEEQVRVQHETAVKLHSLVTEANAAGVSWKKLGQLTGLSSTALFRQAKLGALIIVVRSMHRSETTAERKGDRP